MLKITQKAFSLVELLIVIAILAVLLSVAVKNYFTMYRVSSKPLCISNLKTIDSAVEQWALDYGIQRGTVPDEAQKQEIYSYLKGEKALTCPGGGVYTFGAVGSREQISCSLADSEGHKLPE